MGEAGTRLASGVAPGGNQCGTVYSGWMDGTHPEQVGQGKTGNVCFQDGDNICHRVTVISVWNCRDYFVYQLPNVHEYSQYTVYCAARYCGAD